MKTPLRLAMARLLNKGKDGLPARSDFVLKECHRLAACSTALSARKTMH